TPILCHRPGGFGTESRFSSNVVRDRKPTIYGVTWANLVAISEESSPIVQADNDRDASAILCLADKKNQPMIVDKPLSTVMERASQGLRMGCLAHSHKEVPARMSSLTQRKPRRRSEVRQHSSARRSAYPRHSEPATGRRIASNFAFLSLAELICRATSVIVSLSLMKRLGVVGY